VPSILLVRHAQASFGGGDYDVLSGLAVEQTRALRAHLAARGLALAHLTVVAGPRRRHRETAAQAFPGAPLLIEDDWDEYRADEVIAHYGGPEAAGASLARSAGGPALSSRAFQAVLDAALERWIADPGSTWTPFWHRTSGALARLASELPSGNVGIVFTSAGAIASVAAAVLGAPSAFVPLNRVQLNTGVTKFVVGRAGTSLVSFNDHAHLESPARSLMTYR